jgi:hypothetical protein
MDRWHTCLGIGRLDVSETYSMTKLPELPENFHWVPAAEFLESVPTSMRVGHTIVMKRFEPRYPNVKVRLTKADDVFATLFRVMFAMRRAGIPHDEIAEFYATAMAAKLDNLLAVVTNTVHVEDISGNERRPLTRL